MVLVTNKIVTDGHIENNISKSTYSYIDAINSLANARDYPKPVKSLNQSKISTENQQTLQALKTEAPVL